MTKKEFALIIAALKSAYRNFGVETPSELEFWYEMLSDIDYKILKTAVKKYIVESTFPPTIADLRKSTVNTLEPARLSADEAWGQVTKAIHQFGYYNQDDALGSMDHEVALLVKRFGWQELCVSENQMADRAHFIKLWQIQQEKEFKNKLIPFHVKKQIENIKTNTPLIEKLSEKMTM